MKSFLKTVLAVITGGILLILFPIIIIFIIHSFVGDADEKQISLSENAVLEIDLRIPIIENQNELNYSIIDLKKEEYSFLYKVLKAIKLAKTNENIKSIIIKGGGTNTDYAQLKEIRDALVDFKKNKKPIYAYGELFTQKDYYLASVADEIYVRPLSLIELKGLNAEILFYKKLFDNVGIEFNIFKHGKYKSAVEPLFRENMSEESKFQTKEFLNDIWSVISSEIATSRKMNIEKINQLTDSLSAFTLDKALKEKLIDGISQEKEYLNKLKIKSEDIVSVNDLASLDNTDFSSNEIAVLYATGNIISGDKAQNIQEDFFIKQIEEFTENETIKAVVIRVNSPGGSASSAEKMLYALKQLHLKKPIIMSFGGVAASGGYYIAGASDYIVAEPTTITGSIGVFGAYPTTKGLMNKIGISAENIKTNANSELIEIDEKANPQFIARLTENIETVYNLFIKNVAENRKMTTAQVDSIAQGRVWSGLQAKQVKLIDAYGGLQNAIEIAAKKANLSDYNVVHYPVEKTKFELFMDNLDNNENSMEVKAQQDFIKALDPTLYQAYKEYQYFNQPINIHAKLPYKLSLK